MSPALFWLDERTSRRTARETTFQQPPRNQNECALPRRRLDFWQRPQQPTTAQIDSSDGLIDLRMFLRTQVATISRECVL